MARGGARGTSKRPQRKTQSKSSSASIEPAKLPQVPATTPTAGRGRGRSGFAGGGAKRGGAFGRGGGSRRLGGARAKAKQTAEASDTDKVDHIDSASDAPTDYSAQHLLQFKLALDNAGYPSASFFPSNEDIEELVIDATQIDANLDQLQAGIDHRIAESAQANNRKFSVVIVDVILGEVDASVREQWTEEQKNEVVQQILVKYFAIILLCIDNSWPHLARSSFRWQKINVGDLPKLHRLAFEVYRRANGLGQTQDVVMEPVEQPRASPKPSVLPSSSAWDCETPPRSDEEIPLAAEPVRGALVAGTSALASASVDGKQGATGDRGTSLALPFAQPKSLQRFHSQATQRKEDHEPHENTHASKHDLKDFEGLWEEDESLEADDTSSSSSTTPRKVLASPPELLAPSKPTIATPSELNCSSYLQSLLSRKLPIPASEATIPSAADRAQASSSSVRSPAQVAAEEADKENSGPSTFKPPATRTKRSRQARTYNSIYK